MFSHRPVIKDGIMTGPGIRVFEIAVALQKKGHKVTIAEKDRTTLEKKQGLTFAPWDKNLLLEVNEKYDVSILQPWNDEIDFLEKIKIPKAVDLYSPTLAEHATFCSKETKQQSYFTKGKISYFFDDVISNLSRIILAGDFFICANKSQKEYYMGILNLLGVINPETYQEKIIEIVPFGVSEKGPDRKKKGLKTAKDDLIIAWPGGIAEWFDAETPIRAMKQIKDQHVKLVFVGASNPIDAHFTDKGFQKAKALAQKLGLLDKRVFFHDWIEFEKREIMYNESELVLVTSKKGYENEVSHRTRLIDAIWGEKPIITTADSETSNIVKDENLGLVVKGENEKALAEEIESLLKNRKKRAEISKRMREYKKTIAWSKIISPLDEFCKKPRKLDKDKFSVFSIISEKQKAIEICEKQLELKQRIIEAKEKQIEQKQRTIETNEEELRKNQETIGLYEKEIMHKNRQIEIRQQEAAVQRDEIERMLKLLEGREWEAKRLHQVILGQKAQIEHSQATIRRFKTSVVYPFYRLTSMIGRTRAGRIIAKILK